MGIRISTYIRSLAPLSWRDEFIYMGIVGSVLWAILSIGGGLNRLVAIAAIALWELVHLWWNRDDHFYEVTLLEHEASRRLGSDD